MVIHILSFKKWFENCVKYENLIDKIQVFKSLTTGKLQAFERTTNEIKKKRYTQTKAEEFRQESTAPLHDENEEDKTKVTRMSPLICPVTIQEQPAR